METWSISTLSFSLPSEKRYLFSSFWPKLILCTVFFSYSVIVFVVAGNIFIDYLLFWVFDIVELVFIYSFFDICGWITFSFFLCCMPCALSFLPRVYSTAIWLEILSHGLVNTGLGDPILLLLCLDCCFALRASLAAESCFIEFLTFVIFGVMSTTPECLIYFTYDGFNFSFFTPSGPPLPVDSCLNSNIFYFSFALGSEALLFIALFLL